MRSNAQPPEGLVARLIAAIEAAGGTATLEYLRERVARLPSSGLRRLLERHPEWFRTDGLDHWSLVDVTAADESMPVAPALLARHAVPEYVVIDFETTGPDPRACQIIEIGAVLVRDGVAEDRFGCLVRFEGEVPPDVLQLTGLTQAQINAGRDRTEALSELLAFVGDRLLVAHNAWGFDQVVLESELERWGPTPAAPLRWADTLPIARILYPPPLLVSHSLEDLSQHLGVAVPPSHRAADDAQALVEVVAGLVAEMSTTADGQLVAALLSLTDDPFAELLGWPRPEPPTVETIARLATRTLVPLLPTRAKRAGGLDPLLDVDAAFDRLELGSMSRRESQRTFSRAVTSRLEDGGVLICEAPTGTGKSLGYLVPAIIHSQRTRQSVTVSTYSRELQNQVVEHEAAKLTALLHGRPSICALKGMSNYVWIAGLAREIGHALGASELSRGTAYCLGLVLRLAVASRDGTLDQVDRSSLPRLADSSGSPADFYAALEQCIVGSDCVPTLGLEEFYSRAKSNADAADVVVVNHALLLTSAFNQGDSEAEWCPSYIIVDEAHELESAATLALTKALAESDLQRIADLLAGRGRYSLYSLVREWRGAPGEARQAFRAVRELAGGLGTHIDALGDAVRQYAEFSASPDDATLRTHGATVEFSVHTRGTVPHSNLLTRASQTRRFLRTLGERLRECLDGVEPDSSEQCRRLARLISRCGHSIDAACRLLLGFRAEPEDPPTTVCIVGLDPGERGQAPWRLERVPIRVGPALAESLYDRAETVVLCSATLTAPGRTFDFINDRLGLAEVDEGTRHTLVLGHEFDYASNALLCLPNHLLTPRPERLNQDYPAVVADELDRLIRLFGGSILGLFTAKVRRDAVYRLLAERVASLGVTILSETDPGAVRRFREEPNSVLLGGPGLWVGLDVPGEALRCVTMSKLPFGRPHDPVEVARGRDMERRSSDGRSAFDVYVLPRMIMTLKQGFGRLLRSSTDRGVVVILDKRLRWAGYRPHVLRALPPARISMASGMEMYREINRFLDLGVSDADLPPRPISCDEERLARFEMDLPLPADAGPEQIGRALSLLQEAAEELFGITKLRSPQYDCLREVIMGRDVLLVAPTGSGKSLTFQLPALCRRGLTLVISPLVSLMRDQARKLADTIGSQWVADITHETPVVAQEEALKRARDGELRLLYVSPERLQSPKFRDWLRGIELAQIVIDEAHCISEWGHDFRPHYLRIRSLIECFGEAPVHALTATATDRVRSDIEAVLLGERRASNARSIIQREARSNLRYAHQECADLSEAVAVACAVARSYEGQCGIVYCRTQASAESVAVALRQGNIRAAHYHAGMTYGRGMVEQRFMSGQLDCIAATTAFGMGVDKADVRYVVHVGPSLSIESYIQETGRAGRDGKDALCLLLSWPDCGSTCRRLLGSPEAKQGLPAKLMAVLRRGHRPGVRVLEDGTLLVDEAAVETAMGARRGQNTVTICLHYLEQAGCLEWIEDVDTRSAVVLNGDVQEVAEALSDEYVGDFLRLAHHFGFSQEETSIVDVDQCRDIHPQRIGTILAEASLKETLLYRPFERRHLVRLTGKGSQAAAGRRMSEVASHRHASLDRMLEYMNLPATQCRVAFLEGYLSGKGASKPACGRCDHCSGEPLWTPPPPEVLRALEPESLDPVWCILEAAEECPGVVGAHKFVSHLLGFENSWWQGKAVPLPGQLKGAACHGILKDAIESARLRGIIEAMVREGYLAKADHSTLVLSERGLAVLEGEEEAPTVESLVGEEEQE